MALNDTAQGEAKLSSKGFLSRIASLTPLLIIPLAAFAVLHPTITTVAATVETGALVIAAWALLFRRPSADLPRSFSESSQKLLGVGEILVIAAATLVLVTSGFGLPPTFFFLLMALFYVLMFLSIQGGYEKVWSFVMKLVYGQVLLVESFGSAYPSVFSADSSRDLQIAGLILRHSGGLPARFTGTVWYNFSPIAPISYVVSSLTMGFSLITSELLIGFLVVMLITLTVGGIALVVSGSTRVALLAMLLSSLVPYVWQFATWPLPQVMALAMALLLIGGVIKRVDRPTMLIGGLLALMIVFTHGGVAVELAAVLLLIVVATRSRPILGLFAWLAVTLTIYLVFVTVEGTPTGAVTIVEFIDSLFTLGTAHPAPSILTGIAGPTGIVVGEQVTATYWWVFLGVFGWFGFLAALKTGRFRKNPYPLIVLIALVLLFLGVIIDIVVVSQGQAFRYVSTMGYPLLCIPVAIALGSVMSSSNARRIFVLLAVSFLIFAMVASVSISPELWQSSNQVSYAGYRLSYVTSAPELSSQVVLSTYDTCYPVAANYLPQFTNITATCPHLSAYGLATESAPSTVGVADPHESVGAPFLVLYSFDKASFTSYVADIANPQSNVNMSDSDIVYSSGSNYVAFVG